MTINHGRLGAVYRMLLNNYKPASYAAPGLNDLIWGTPSGQSDSSYFEVVIDGVGTGTAGVDTFKWRENGGAWTLTVDITGASQDLVGANMTQPITFAATTGHTAADQWTVGNLYNEATTESTSTAQITDTTMRLLNPNATITWTDDGGASLINVDYSQGKAYFDAAVGNVTVSGNNAFYVYAGLTEVGFIFNWSANFTLDSHDLTVFQDAWQTMAGGIARGAGSCEGFQANRLWDDAFDDQTDNTQMYWFLELFSYDPDDDRTGDHWDVWCIMPGLTYSAPVGDYIKETINFELIGYPLFTANA